MIRNVCIMSHGGAGKTSLCEAMLHNAKASERFGKVADGTTVMDFDPEEIKRKISINTAIASLEWRDNIINLLDTPGYFDFVGEVMEGLRVADGALIVLSGKSGVAVGTEISWDRAASRNLPTMFFINKLDDERADFQNVLSQIRDTFGTRCVPFQLPIKEGDKLTGFINVIGMHAHKYEKDGFKPIDIPDNYKAEADAAREMLLETVAETDETLMEKFFGGETFTNDEIDAALKKAVRTRDVFPVFCGSATENFGMEVLMDSLSTYMPGPEEVAPEKGEDAKGNEYIVKCNDSEPLVALIFKTVADPYVGRLSYFRVLSGTMTPDMAVVNGNTGAQEKISRLYYVKGKKQIEAKKIGAGDIGAIPKLTAAKTGDTLCKAGNPIKVEGVSFPQPNLTMAIVSEKGEEEKVSAGLNKLMDEDKTFSLINNSETRQMLISGVGEQQLDVIASKLKAKFSVTLKLDEPRVPYRETIRNKTSVEYTHKKQSGGSGQYARVVVEFEPNAAEPGSEKLLFEEKVFGGAVPRNFYPAVEKGLQESIQKGVLAGYPVVGLKATLVDGKHHPVDSNEMAFKLAASGAYKEGMGKTSPVLLEPIGRLEANVPDSYMGDVIADVNKRRGRVIGMNPGQLVAEVPMAEMHKYATDLRSITQGRGAFTFEFERYEEAPSNVAQKVIELATKE